MVAHSLVHYLPAGGGGGNSQKNWVGVCGPLPKTLTLFMTNIRDFPYPIYDLTKNLIPYLCPDPYTVTVNIICVGLLLLVLSSVAGDKWGIGRQSADGRRGT